MKMHARTVFTLLISLLPVPALAQVDPLSAMDQMANLFIEGNGWDEWQDKAELFAFLVDAIVTLALAALIAHHPVRRRAPVTLALSLIHISEPTRLDARSRMPSSA